ncbi:alpha/beta fold hydrolase [Sphingomonas sp. CGMCC 1.13654]|uniref:Alpha/beta fold hydrolase n=1 Tax=Sphingomonas chungangi TaxID=2683589 RepID=A0A838LDS1_9SPHN|nr:alpha/beta fold hydrolase [Sphingomonas chungangi]MBA2936286.1 alpha/beta fold hydrolase [Sphingomonas chungangi]MVW55671.1 alpha/beta fold hydrolase [Sphingomonas chungangi]
MASSPTDLPVRRFKSFDGEEIAYRELGEGRPLVLIHGFFSTATVNWLRYGHAERIAAEGYRVIMPDLRGHGDSTKSHDPAAYPKDALADDGFALIEHLGLTDYDLGGYSLGGRTTMRMLVRGAKPAKAICGGMGLQGTVNAVGRGGHFRNILTHLGTFERGSPEWMAEAFLKTTGGDPVALLHVLETFVDTPIEAIRATEAPVLVVSGKDDDDNGSAESLADALPHGEFAIVPGNHMSAVTNKALGEAMARFLAG